MKVVRLEICPKCRKETLEVLSSIGSNIIGAQKRCSNCGAMGNLEFHHIKSLSKGGTNNIKNIKVLCFECHKLVHKNIKNGN